MKSAVVIIPTTGKDTLLKSVTSALLQDFKNIKVLLVIDGKEYFSAVQNIVYKIFGCDISDKGYDRTKLEVVELPTNVGKDGWYGHRIYSAFSLLVDQDYVLYLDEDNFIDKNHVSSMVSLIEENNLDWCHSLRKIVDENGSYIMNDDCESLGGYRPYTNYNHVDTSCYCLTLDTARRFSGAIFGKYGADRQFYNVLSEHAPNFDTTGLYTLNYRLGGNVNSVQREFFERGNNFVGTMYEGEFPWRK